MLRIVYKKQEAHYKWLIKQKCRASFELFCQQLVANKAFDLPYKITTGKIRKQTVLQSVKTSNGQFTNTVEETIQTIVQALFPTDDSTQETHVQRKKRETVNTYSNTILDKRFTKQEITYSISTMKKKKAPGIDGISIEIIKELHDMNPDILHYTYNKCLELGIFPETWKKRKLIIFSKPGKVPSLPNAYRPICLLSVLGKILDKLLVFRITHLLHKSNKLHKQQHGFRNGRSCETANFRLWQAINIALQERVPVTLLSLDVQVLEALNTFKASKQDILAIKNDILETSKEKSITLHWIPAHTGIQGNETADSYAEKATTRPNIEKIPKKSFKQLKMRFPMCKCRFGKSVGLRPQRKTADIQKN
ncbi:Putative protein in type-1 retrotransposable element R1DM [Araneus ventricosus]|uniref:RNase H type-1 domain-containing protein n=1 Tax=Araneus ventricosus TaxID=182803 RepID=A0A4Y2PKW4_ARAVE|nr:Putative protein in type-1 retrotransposable element R1DM [Araneus ventricosus]